MPLPDRHTARQIPPASCDKIRSEPNKLGPGIDVLWCVRAGKATVPQSIHFDAARFTPDEARAWLKKHDFSTANFEPASGKGKAAAAQFVDLAAEGLPCELRAYGGSEALQIEAQAAGGPADVRPFNMVAYTGAAMRVEGFSLPVVVDLEGLKVPNQRRPILRQHDPDRIVGHSESVDVTPQRLKLAGFVSGVSDDAKEVIALADRKFPWQASIGASVQKMEFVDKDQDVKVNGRAFRGPLYVARQTVLGEVSFVPVGADGATAATVA